MATHNGLEKEAVRVLFVCTGNIIRSAMAKAFLETRLPSRLEGRVTVDSAGVAAMDGNLATDEAVLVMAEQGIDLARHRAKFLNHDHIRSSDLILVMEKNHLRHIELFYRSAKKEIHLLREFGLEKRLIDVPDPYGKSVNHYRSCRDLIESCMAGVIAWIEQNKKI
jgi:protein-tyrosine phosphatase